MCMYMHVYVNKFVLVETELNRAENWTLVVKKSHIFKQEYVNIENIEIDV